MALAAEEGGARLVASYYQRFLTEPLRSHGGDRGEVGFGGEFRLLKKAAGAGYRSELAVGAEYRPAQDMALRARLNSGGRFEATASFRVFNVHTMVRGAVLSVGMRLDAAGWRPAPILCLTMGDL